MTLKDRNRLKGHLLVQGITHRELAAGIGLKSHGYIGALLRGEAKNVKPETAARISVYLGVGLDDLWLARSSTDARRAAEHYATYSAQKADAA